MEDYVIYAREGRGRRARLLERASADDLDGATLAVRTLAGDLAEAGLPVERLGVYDRSARRWIQWPWGCADCGLAGPTAGHVCPDCLRDRSLGEEPGTSRAEHEDEIRRDEDRRAFDQYADFVGRAG